MLFTAAAAAHHATLLFGSMFFAVPVSGLGVSGPRGRPAGFDTGLYFSYSHHFSGGWRRNRHRSSAVLDRADSLSRHANADSARQPGELHSQPAVGPELLRRSLWSPDSGFAVHLVRGATVARLRPLLLGFWVAFLVGLGGTTPVGHLLLGRAFDVLTMERFSYWATLLALPFVGLLAAELVDRYRLRAAVGLIVALAAFSCATSRRMVNLPAGGCRGFQSRFGRLVAQS